MQRVSVVGTSGSGKTSFARRLASRLGVAHVELDSLHWEPGWRSADREAFRARARAALSGESWVCDGNYHVVRDLVWSRADTVVWLDFPLPVILWRLTSRILHRTLGRQELWNGNREKLWVHFFSRESLYLWVLKTYRRRRREYAQLLALTENAHLRVVRLNGPRAAREWLGSATAATGPARLA
jgi:adenylate kinase family enzyme